MQRVVSINLNGNAYQLEENGYNALFAYLDATESALKDSPDRAQKLADLERLIAEKCQALLGPHKTVVTSAEIDRILLDLGPAPAQPAAEANATSGSASSTTSSAPNPPSSSFHHRLVQIREGAMLSGVCVGLSEFLRIDVTLIRILFVIFALASSGFGILAYGVLMFLLPRVDTRAQASDANATAAAPHRWPWDDHGWPWDHNGGHPHVFGTVIMIIFLMMAFSWLSFWSRGHLFFGWPFFWGFPHWIGIIVFFMLLRLIFMPFRMARRYGYGPYGPYGPYPHPHYAWISMWNGLMWFAAMIFFVWVAFHYIPEVHDMFL